jgi:hypothetical protein
LNDVSDQESELGILSHIRQVEARIEEFDLVFRAITQGEQPFGASSEPSSDPDIRAVRDQPAKLAFDPAAAGFASRHARNDLGRNSGGIQRASGHGHLSSSEGSAGTLQLDDSKSTDCPADERAGPQLLE